MRYRTFGRTGWQVSEIGYGMWGMGSWSGSDDEQSLESIHRAVELGCNFFDTAWAYGEGHSEGLLGRLLRERPGTKLFAASKIPPKNFKWPARPEYALDETYPADHVREYLEKTLKNVGVPSVDLIQFHVWDDRWADDDRWQRLVSDLKKDGLIRAFGISLNRFQPWNGIRALRTGLVDSVQVVYNIFDQAPEDELLPVCRELNVAVIARVPFDEGTLTGALRLDSRWPEGDWRNTYFHPDNLRASVARADGLTKVLPDGMTLPEAALRFIVSNPDVATTIPGMRKLTHVQGNLSASDRGPLPSGLLQELRKHRWDRKLQ